MTEGIFAALASVQNECEAPKKNANNPHFKSKFADLTQVLECLHEPLSRHGLAVLQVPVTENSCAGVHTKILHSSGSELDCGRLLMPLERTGPQAVGSAITYARRYSLMAIFRLSAEDDDAETAEGRGRSKPVQQKKAATEDATSGMPRVTVDEYGINVPTSEEPIFGKTSIHPNCRYSKAPIEYIRQVYATHYDAMNAAQREWCEYAIERAERVGK